MAKPDELSMTAAEIEAAIRELLEPYVGKGIDRRQLESLIIQGLVATLGSKAPAFRVEVEPLTYADRSVGRSPKVMIHWEEMAGPGKK